MLREESEGGVEAVRLEPLYGSPLHAQPPGVETGQQSRPAGGTLGADVGLGQLHSSPGQALETRLHCTYSYTFWGREEIQNVFE